MWTVFVGALFCATQVDAVLDNVQKRYLSSGDMSAQFEQTYTEYVRKKKRVEKGALWLKQDGRVRWSYLSPHVKDFVFDGKTAYFYEPEHAQVTVFDDFNKSDLGQVTSLLWGQGNIKERFQVEPCAQQCPPSPNSVTALWLTPRKPMAHVKNVVLWVNKDTSYVQKTILWDLLKNTTEYAFINLKAKENIENKKFVFKTPSGVSVLRSAM